MVFSKTACVLGDPNDGQPLGSRSNGRTAVLTVVINYITKHPGLVGCSPNTQCSHLAVCPVAKHSPAPEGKEALHTTRWLDRLPQCQNTTSITQRDDESAPHTVDHCYHSATRATAVFCVFDCPRANTQSRLSSGWFCRVPLFSAGHDMLRCFPETERHNKLDAPPRAKRRTRSSQLSRIYSSKKYSTACAPRPAGQKQAKPSQVKVTWRRQGR